MSKLRAALAIAIALTTTLTFAPNGYTEPVKVNRVLSVVPDASGKFLVVNTSLPRPVSAPIIQYFPGPDGNSIMVADFFGLTWSQPSGLINHPAIDPAIKQIRFGQFQENPPTFRISVITNNPSRLRQLTFKSTPGTLIVKWPGYQPSRETREIAVAPPIIKKEVAQPIGTSFGRGNSLGTSQKASLSNSQTAYPPVAPAMLSTKSVPPATLPPLKTLTSTKTAMVENPKIQESKPPTKAAQMATATTAIPKVSATVPPTSVKAAPPVKPVAEMPNPIKSTQATTAAAFNPVSNSARKLIFTSLSRLRDLDSNGNHSATPVEAILSENSAVIKVHANPSLAYRAFRLHDPERYVLDIDGMPELLTTEAPIVESNPFLNSIRVGAPSTGENLARIVLDLTNPNVTVKEKLTNTDNMLTLTVSTKQNLIDDLTVIPGTKVVLDAGHGGTDPGAQRAAIQEKELTLAITEKLKSTLIHKGVKVEMTRSDDTFVSLEDRVKITNATRPDAFVSVHINSLEASSNIQGIETYYQTGQSKPLADVIHQSLVGGLQVPDRSVRKARFYVINHTDVPAVLAEVGYITNKEERDKLISADYQNQIADAIARGVILYLNKHYQANAAPENAGRVN